MELLAFILVSVAVIAVPGPNVLVVVSTSLGHGRTRGLQTVAGTSAAMIIQLILAAVGTTWFVSALSQGFLWLKWAGVIYLLFLGASHLFSAISNDPPRAVSASGSFQRGFWVSLTNPKTILFFSAFLPQFTSASLPYLEQIAVLSSVFWVLAVLLDSGYALLAGKFSMLLHNRNLSRIQNGASSLLYLGAGTTLALTRHGQ
jgi:threonine/homoserine/homoserine lactone efflux protein